MNVSCLFCLELMTENKTRNPIGCACKLSAHKQCIETWFQQKNQMECPICHTIAIPNRMMLENFQIVYIDMTAERRREERFRNHEKAAAFCCCLLLGWALGFTVIDLISRA